MILIRNCKHINLRQKPPKFISIYNPFPVFYKFDQFDTAPASYKYIFKRNIINHAKIRESQPMIIPKPPMGIVLEIN